MSDSLSTRITRRLRRLTQRAAHPKIQYKRGRIALKFKGAVPDGPIFITFHGGGWVGGAPEDQSVWSQFFAERGRMAYSVQYSTFQNSGGTLDTALKDAFDAGVYIARKHPRTPLVFCGHSAGAPLAFWAAVPQQQQLAGFIFFSPVTDLAKGGFSNRQIPDGGREDASPQQNLSKLELSEESPFLLAYHGADDDVVPIAQVESFVNAWKDAGSDVARLRAYGGQKHGFQNLENPRLAVQTDLEADLVALGVYSRPAFLDER